MSCCLIGLGSNLGDRPSNLAHAVTALGQHPQMRIVAVSRWLETSPVGGPPGQGGFLNGAVLAETALSPQPVLDLLRGIEASLGRRRGQRWGPRAVDLDLLLYDQLVLSTPCLVLPHPRMAWRRFVLQPAAEVAGAMVHPTTGWSVARLLEHLDTAVPYVAITGSIGAGKTLLAEQLAQQTGARPITEPIDSARLEAFYADPASHAWETELEFLHRRARLLAADAPQWSTRKTLAISDFWFDQSLAFARVWLRPDQHEAFRAEWTQWRSHMVQPKLIVLLDVPAERLLERVRRRGRPYERGLDESQLERIGQSILDQAGQPDLGPILRIATQTPEEVLTEVQAAVEAME